MLRDRMVDDDSVRQISPSQKLDQYIVRFPDGMREAVKAHAALNRRSMNAEIVRMVEHVLQTETADRSAKSISAA